MSERIGSVTSGTVQQIVHATQRVIFVHLRDLTVSHLVPARCSLWAPETGPSLADPAAMCEGHGGGFPMCLLPFAPPGPPRGLPGHGSDVKAGLAPGIQEGQQSSLEVREASYITLHEGHLVLKEQRGAHLRGGTSSGYSLAGACPPPPKTPDSPPTQRREEPEHQT